MRQYRIKMTELAEHDLESLADYIAHELMNPVVAMNMVRGIRQRIRMLQTFPERNSLHRDSILANLGVRSDYYKNYEIYYSVDKKAMIVYILRILHMLVEDTKTLYSMFGLSGGPEYYYE